MLQARLINLTKATGLKNIAFIKNQLRQSDSTNILSLSRSYDVYDETPHEGPGVHPFHRHHRCHHYPVFGTLDP